MTAQNLKEFNTQVLRLIAALYKSHPRPVPISSSSDYDAGTILWMHRNGYVLGDVRETQTLTFIPNAQLSASALRTLLLLENSSHGKTLGEFVLSKSSGTSVDEKDGALLVARLLGV